MQGTQLNLFAPAIEVIPVNQGICALSVRQPWAYAIFHGKDIENRNWAIAPGLLVIQAAKTFKKREFMADARFCYMMGVPIPPPDELAWGAAIGVTEVIKVVDNRHSPEQKGWGFPHQRHWHLAYQKLFSTSVPMLGKLGLFNSGLSLKETNQLCGGWEVK